MSRSAFFFSAARGDLLESVDSGEGHPLSVDEIYRQFAAYVATIGLRLIGQPDEVEDFVHDVFLEVRRDLKTLNDRERLRGWLATIAVRVAQRRLKRRAWWQRLWQRSVPEQLSPVTAASPEDAVLIAAIYRTLDRLPAEQRIAWVLRYLEGERLDQVALLCGCSLATAKRRIAAAHGAVKEAIDAR